MSAHDILRQRERELAGMRPAYLKARKILDKESLPLLKEILAMIRQYQAGDPSEKAIYLMAQLALLTKPIQKAMQQIQAFEGADENYQKIRNTIPKETPRGVQEPN